MGLNKTSLNCPRRESGFLLCVCVCVKSFDWKGWKDFIVLPELVIGSWLQV